MKTSNVFLWTIGLLFAQATVWLIVLALYLSVNPEVIQYSTGVA